MRNAFFVNDYFVLMFTDLFVLIGHLRREVLFVLLVLGLVGYGISVW